MKFRPLENFHPKDSVIPADDHLARPSFESEWARALVCAVIKASFFVRAPNTLTFFEFPISLLHIVRATRYAAIQKSWALVRVACAQMCGIMLGVSWEGESGGGKAVEKFQRKKFPPARDPRPP